MMKQYPDREECIAMRKEYGTPDHVCAHCDEVARVAVRIGRRLNEKGYHLDLGLTQAAGMLHDIARKEHDHARVGAEVVRSYGYPAVAAIIAVHMHYPEFSPVEKINETDLVCLGDRTVKFDHYVGLDERMEYIMDKARHNAGKEKEEVLARIRRSREQLRRYLSELEQVMGISLDDLMKG